MTEDITSGGLARILARFARLHPGVAVRTHVDQSLTLEAELDAGESDLAVMQLFKHRLRPSDLVLLEDRVHWVKSPDLRLDRARPIPFLAFDDRCFLKRWAMDEAAPVGGTGFVTVLECASTAGIVSGVHAGLGVSLLNARHLTPRIQVVDDAFDPQPPDTAYVVRLGRKSRSEAAHALARSIVEETDRWGGRWSE